MSGEVGAIRGSASARQIRRARARRLARRFVLWVGVPTMLAVVYYGFWATPQYESVSVFSVQSNSGHTGALEGIAAFLPTAATSPQDAMLVKEYSRSRAMLDRLLEKHSFMEHYRSAGADYWSRLDSDASPEQAYDYFLDKVHVSYAPEGRTLTVKVRAFSPEDAQRINQAILHASEEMLNEMSERGRRDRIAFAKEALHESEERLGKARQAVLRLQAEGHDLSPHESASAVLGIRAQLEGQLAEARAELGSLESVMTGQHPKVMALRQKVRALERQVEAQTRRLVDSKGEGIGSSIADFEPVMFEKEVAQRAYETALQSIEVARIEGLREQRYLVTMSPPSMPGQSTHPKRLWGIATVFVLSVVLMAVLSMLAAAIREHAKF